MTFNTGVIKVSMRDILIVLFRHKKKIVSVFALGAVLTVLAVFTAADIYRSQARLLIRLGRENLAVDPSVSGPTVSAFRDRESEVNSELTILLSRNLIEQVVDELGEETLISSGGKADGAARPVKAAFQCAKGMVKSVLVASGVITAVSPREKAVNTIAEQLSAFVEKRTSVITATLDSESPELSQRTLDTLIRLYLEHHIKVYAAQASPEFFEGQAEQFRNSVQQSERLLAAFRAENGIANMDQQKQVLLTQISDLERQLTDATSQAKSIDARINALNSAVKENPTTRELSRTTGRTNYAADGLKAKLTELHLQEIDLAARYTETHRPLVELREQIRQLEGALAQEQPTHTEVTTGVDLNAQQLHLTLEMQQAELEAQRSRKKALEKELAAQQERLTVLVSREAELAMLERDVQVAEGEYTQYRDNLQRAKVSAALDTDNVSNVSVVQAATWPQAPIGPNRPLSLVLGLVIAAVGSILLAFVVEYFSDTIHSKDDVETHLGVPVLAAVSEKEYARCT